MNKENKDWLFLLADADFWKLFGKLSNDDEEMSIEDIGYLVWCIIKSKLDSLNNDDREKIELLMLKNKILSCLNDFEYYFTCVVFKNEIISQSSYEKWFNSDGMEIIRKCYFENDIAENYIASLLDKRMIEKALISLRGEADFTQIGKDEYGIIYGVNIDVPESVLFLDKESALNFLLEIKERFQSDRANLLLDFVREKTNRSMPIMAPFIPNDHHI